MLTLLSVVSAAALGGCNSPFPSACALASCSLSAEPPAPGPGVFAASDHGWRTTVRASLADIRTLYVYVTVNGPLTLESGCVATLSAWVVAADGSRFEPSPRPEVAPCSDPALEDVAAGRTLNLVTVIERPPISGSYTVQGKVRIHGAATPGPQARDDIPVVKLAL